MAPLKAQAHWVNRDTIGWLGAEAGDVYRLYYSLPGATAMRTPDGGFGDAFIPLGVDHGGLSPLIVEKFRFLKGATALKIAEAELALVPRLLKVECLV